MVIVSVALDLVTKLKWQACVILFVSHLSIFLPVTKKGPDDKMNDKGNV